MTSIKNRLLRLEKGETTLPDVVRGLMRNTVKELVEHHIGFPPLSEFEYENEYDGAIENALLQHAFIYGTPAFTKFPPNKKEVVKLIIKDVMGW